MRPVPWVFLTAALSACTQTGSVHMMGPDTFSISAAAAPAAGGASGARQIALSEANAHCQKMGRHILVTNTGEANMNALGAGRSEITFRCLPKGDPELQRPLYDTAPSAVIEDRRGR